MTGEISAKENVALAFLGTTNTVDLKVIAIDAACFVPVGAPNYDMQANDSSMFDYVAELIRFGHDVEFLVPTTEEKEAAEGFLHFLNRRSTYPFTGLFVAKIPSHVKDDSFDFLITNRPSSFQTIMSPTVVSSFDSNLSEQVVRAHRFAVVAPKVI